MTVNLFLDEALEELAVLNSCADALALFKAENAAEQEETSVKIGRESDNKRCRKVPRLWAAS